MDQPKSIILVYDADSGLRAMLLDVLKKVSGREECALCEITYSPIGKRRSWAACEARLGVPVEELHRDQLPPAWGSMRAELPCILVRAKAGPPTVLLTRDAIAKCRGSVTELERQLRDALAAAAPDAAPPP